MPQFCPSTPISREQIQLFPYILGFPLFGGSSGAEDPSPFPCPNYEPLSQMGSVTCLGQDFGQPQGANPGDESAKCE